MRQKGWISIALLAIVVLVAVVGAYYLGKNSSNKGSVLLPTPSEPSASALESAKETQSWKKYKIKAVGTEFAIPDKLSSLGTLEEMRKEGEKGSLLCMNFKKKSSFLVRSVYAGGSSCGAGPFVVGGSSYDFEAGRGGSFTDLQGYTTKDGKYFVKMNLDREVEISSQYAKELINPYGVRILRIEWLGKGPADYMEVGNPGENKLGALINTLDRTYPGMSVVLDLQESGLTRTYFKTS